MGWSEKTSPWGGSSQALGTRVGRGPREHLQDSTAGSTKGIQVGQEGGQQGWGRVNHGRWTERMKAKVKAALSAMKALTR